MTSLKGPSKIVSIGFMVALGLILSMVVNSLRVSAEAEDFKIGVFWVPPAAYTNATQYDYLQEAHVNWIINVASTDLNSVAINETMLDLAAERGMKAVVADSRFDKVYNNTATDAEIDAMANDYKGHPGLGGYYVMDEPEFANISYAGHAYNRFLSNDPDSSPYLNLLPYVWNKPQYEQYVDDIIDAADLKYLTFDNYPFKVGYDAFDDYYTNLKIIREKGLTNNLKIAAYIQACGYVDMRLPVENELRYNVFTSLAYGAKSLYWFPYWHPGVPFSGAIINEDGTKTSLYEPFKNLNAQMKAWGPTLMKLTSMDVYHSGTMAAGTIGVPSDFQWQPNAITDNVILSYFTDASGRKYVMAVNRDYTNSLTLTFNLNPKPSTVTEVSKTTGLEVSTNYNPSTGVISAAFAPGEGRLYALPADGTGELLTNPGFEAGKMGWKTYNASTLTSVTTPVNTGSKALGISARSTNHTGPMQDIKSILLSSGQGTYNFGAMLRTETGTQTMYVNININDSTGDHYYNGSFESVGNGSWVRSSGSANLTWTGKLNYARIYTESASGTGNYLVDDFSLKKPELLANPGFEDRATGWSSYNSSTLTPVTSPVKSGSKALKISDRANNYTGPMQDIKSILQGNGQGTYNFGANLRTEAGTQTMYVNIFVNDSTGDHYYNGALVSVGSGAWVNSAGSANITWTGTLNYARIYTESQSGTGSYFVDDFSLKKAELLVNQGFEEGATGWSSYNSSILTPVTTPVKSGSKALKISSRGSNYTGPMQDIKSILQSNGQGTYSFGANLRTEAGTQPMYVNVYVNDSAGDHYFNGALVSVGSGGWVSSSGSANITWTGTLNYARIYTESQSGTGNYFVDDFSLNK
ncbi:carbohydrate binding domain-containing protein [Paenibacillus eucommiae]|uniref:CBM-cenC domain-containing protein n=1 Tax=Paenibacillus eucommiae TaxID=1355755 RepID=A0ABS4IPH4_9BACL|nr:carbohydrate binding domain-containing protein [Paenibacillus eucommiae]MBP1988826.1 hypothetical protein [Paenibacillus eucommiae]